MRCSLFGGLKLVKDWIWGEERSGQEAIEGSRSVAVQRVYPCILRVFTRPKERR
jgi:hypothetical protein